MAVQRRRRKRKQRGGALMRRKPRLVDKIAHGLSMVLSGPAPGFGLALGKLGAQALKGVTDNVQYYRQRPQKGSGWWQDFKRNTRQGYKESRDAIKKTKLFNVCCPTPRVHGVLEETTTTTTTTSTRGFFFERVGPSHGRVGESRSDGNG